MNATSIVIILIILAIGMYITRAYNRLIAQIEAMKNNNKQIDVQLDRRYKVFQSLIEVVKKYMDYEKTTLKEVTSLRTQAEHAKDSGDHATRMAAEEKISKIAAGINLVFENYPDLKASQNAQQLQEEIVNTENKLAYAKQAYNDSVERYNAYRKSLFASMVVALMRSKLLVKMPYWQLDEQQVKEQETYTVKL